MWVDQHVYMLKWGARNVMYAFIVDPVLLNHWRARNVTYAGIVSHCWRFLRKQVVYADWNVRVYFCNAYKQRMIMHHSSSWFACDRTLICLSEKFAHHLPIISNLKMSFLVWWLKQEVVGGYICTYRNKGLMWSSGCPRNIWRWYWRVGCRRCRSWII